MPKPKDIFLVAHYARVPRNKAKTHMPGYITNDENMSYTENVTVTRGLKNRDLTAAIILNLTQKTVQKFRFEGKKDWESLAAYYANGYPQYLKLINPPEADEEKPAEADEEKPAEADEEKPAEADEDVNANVEETGEAE